MEASVLETVGQVAGIGGIALGVVLIVFREIIRKKIFPQLTKQQAYSLLRLITVFTFSVAIAGIGAWVWVKPRTTVEVEGGIGAGRDINARDIIIQGTPRERGD